MKWGINGDVTFTYLNLRLSLRTVFILALEKCWDSTWN